MRNVSRLPHAKDPSGPRMLPRQHDGIQSPRSRGFTLIELLVALALGAIIAVMISFISTTARDAYTNTVQKVEVYNRFRLAFSTLKKDLTAWIPTRELEYYVDGRGGRPRDFRWEPGEEIQDRTDELGPGVVDGGVYKDYDEFAYILQRQYESVEKAQIRDGTDVAPKYHDAYQAYFRTMTYVDGAFREANVEYMLVDTSRPMSEWRNGVPPPPTKVQPDDVKDLALYKVVRYLQINAQTIQRITSYPIKRRVLEVASNVTDFRVEYLTVNPFLRRAKGVTVDFKTPELDYKYPIERVTRPEMVKKRSSRDAVARPIFRKTFGYGSMKADVQYPRATAFVGAWGDDQLRARFGHEPTSFGFTTNPDIQFAELTAGDTIDIFREVDRSSGGGGGGAVTQLVRFPSGNYTVRTNIQGKLQFYEIVDTSSWKDKDQFPILYKAAFVPSALRITLRMVDDEGLNPKTMQQVIWLRRKAR